MNRPVQLGLTAVVCLLAVSQLLLARPALAADGDYVFGTSLVITSPSSLTPHNGSWDDQLPKAYRFSQGSIIDEINRARAARGNKTEVDVAAYPIVVGAEVGKDGKFEYSIDFQQMLPEDIDVALKKFPLTGKLAALPHAYRPIAIGYFNGDSTDGGASVTVTVLGKALSFNTSDSYSHIREAVASELAQRFKDRAKFDLSINNFQTVVPNSPSSFSIYVTVYLDGAEKTMNYGGEGGE
jgi:hypothetical protein